ncbi:MAG TPA: M28 family peptidase, partial [Tepidisphaeraceae bacterium]
MSTSALSLWRLRPPADDIDRFSTANAIEHDRFIASERHPVGAPHHQVVCDYLVNQFQKLGYNVQIQDARYGALPLRNILARKPGTVPGGKAVMLAAHYDSVRSGPGAADD